MKNKISYLIFFIFFFFIPPLSLLSNLYGDQQNFKNSYNSNPILSDVTVGDYTVPGVTDPIPSNQIVRIGILGDMNDITGNHSWKGAMLAAREINEAGGLLLNGTSYYIGLVGENTDEANPNLDLATGVIAAMKMVNDHEPHFILGGFRFESLYAYREVVMDAGIPFICTGCSVEDLNDDVITDYGHYKYFFRMMPINTTSLALELVSYISELADYLSTIYDGNVTKVEILEEDLHWTSLLSFLLNIYLTSYNLTVDETTVPLDASPLMIRSILSSLDSSGAQIVIPLVSGHLGTYIGQYYGELKPKFLLTGLNFRSQSDIYWDDTAGGSQYEIVMQSACKTSKTPLTIPFWNNFFEEYGEEPYFTAVGSYDAVRLLANATFETQAFNSDSIVSNLEGKDINNPFIGTGFNIAFSNSHDIVEGWPYGTSLFCQWQMDANKVVVPSWDTIYPDSIATGTLEIPYWGINDLVEDNSHKLPGNFTLSSDADEIDSDGNFNLSWTPSEGADSYSIYYSENPITYVSKRYTTLVHNDANTPYPILDLEDGDYYFVVVAYNQTGQTFSNNVFISVQISDEGEPKILGYDLLLVIPIFLFITLTLVKRFKREKH